MASPTGSFLLFMKSVPPTHRLAAVALMLALGACAKKTEAPAVAAAAPAAKIDARSLLPLGPAPAWSLKDVNGRVVSSDQFKGKVVVIDFWATWCPPCRAEIPGYTDLQRKYGKDGLVIVGISVDQGGPGIVKEFIEKYGVNYPVVMADEQVVAAFGHVEYYPTTFLIDRTGQVRDRKDGMEETADYEKKIVALLN